jgi:hypothetical protein
LYEGELVGAASCRQDDGVAQLRGAATVPRQRRGFDLLYTRRCPGEAEYRTRDTGIRPPVCSSVLDAVTVLPRRGFVDDAAILAMARQIRAELPGLLPTLDADRLVAIAAELDELIDRAENGGPARMPILRLLGGQPALRRRANELADPAVFRGVVPPPGPVRVPVAPRYVCPNGDYEFFRRDVSQPIPVCPHDGAGLIPGDQA